MKNKIVQRLLAICQLVLGKDLDNTKIEQINTGIDALYEILNYGKIQANGKHTKKVINNN